MYVHIILCVHMYVHVYVAESMDELMAKTSLLRSVALK